MTAHNTPTDLTQCTAEQLLHLYRSGQASPVDSTKALLARIEKLNPKLNAFTLVDEKVAMNCAKSSEAKWQAHRKAALHGGAEVGALEGVPASIKDLIHGHFFVDQCEGIEFGIEFLDAR